MFLVVDGLVSIDASAILYKKTPPVVYRLLFYSVRILCFFTYWGDLIIPNVVFDVFTPLRNATFLLIHLLMSARNYCHAVCLFFYYYYCYFDFRIKIAGGIKIRYINVLCHHVAQ